MWYSLCDRGKHKYVYEYHRVTLLKIVSFDLHISFAQGDHVATFLSHIQNRPIEKAADRYNFQDIHDDFYDTLYTLC